MHEERPSIDLESAPTLHPDRWMDVKAIFELALTLDSSEWSCFLRLKCGDDQLLLGEVQSLLSAHNSDSEFLEEPIASLKGSLEAPDESPASAFIGSRIGAYILERELGAGGMGAVFLADRADDDFRKRVAIKLIRTEKVNDFMLHRFRQERQILAGLEHPFIAQLIDGGTTPSGMPYFVMEYVEGQVLNQYCESHNLNTRERLELFLKICSAVQYAHDRQIIHRDLKPGNILVTGNGTPKLLDFGIAKMLQPVVPGSNKEATAVGMRMLTPAYASPEQMHGDSATAVSDIYSLGVVLYELLCGERPSLLTVQQTNTSTGDQNSHLSRSLRAIIYRAIRLAPADRYSSVAVFAEDIRRYLSGLPTRASLPEVGLPTADKIPIAILPFRLMGQEPAASAFLKTALTDALIMRLSKVDSLSVRPTSAVLRYANEQDTSRAARELRVKYLLEGTSNAVAGSLRLNVQLVSTETGQTVWAASFEEQSGDLLKLEDSISEQIAFALVPQLTGEEREQLSKAGTSSEVAHQAYLRGRFHWSRSAGEPEELTKALLYFSQAIAADPNYARAHAGIADYYLRLGLWGGMPPAESFAAGIASAETALAIDPMLAEAHAALGFCLWAHRRDYAGAEREFQLAIARNPEYASAHHWFGLLNSSRNRPQLALANLERAYKVDPYSPVIAAALGFVHYNARDYDKALDLLLGASRDLRHSAVLHEMLAWCYLQLQQKDKALQHALQAVEAGERSAVNLAVLARVYGEIQQGEQARTICAELAGLRDRQYVSGYDMASAMLGIHDVDSALTSLERSFEDRDWWVCWIDVDPRWDPLRNDSRFSELLRKVQAPATLESTSTNPDLPATVDKRSLIRFAVAAAAILLVSLGAWFQLRNPSTPFVNPRFFKLTGDGTAQLAAISHDGRSVVYTTSNKGQTRLWKRAGTPSGAAVLLAEMPGDITGLDFTRNGRYIGFQNHPVLQPFHRQLYIERLEGGQPQPLLGEMKGPASLSFDGSIAAAVRADRARDRDEIAVINLRDRSEQIVATVRYPSHISAIAQPAWSSDSRFIAFPVEQRDAKGFFIGVNVLDLHTRQTTRVLSPRWLSIHHLTWAKGHAGLAMVGREQNSSFQQIWWVPYPSGAAVRLGNDVDSYVGASLTADASTLVSVRRQTLARIYSLQLSSLRQHMQITPGTGRYFDLSWTPGGKLLYASDSTGSADIWMMDSDGGNSRQLTAGDGLNWAPASSPDGRMIAFHANPKGSWQIWRADPDGAHSQQLTEGAQDSNWPQFTPDGQSIVFHRTDKSGSWSIWKVPVAGGIPVQITRHMSMHPAVSFKDGRLAAWYSADLDKPHWQLAIFNPEGGDPVKTFDPAMPITPDSQLGWSPSGDGITFLSQRNGVWNLWMQPVDGRAPWPLTFFNAGQIYSFSWSRSGRLAFAQGNTTTDVVLVRAGDSHQ